MKAKVPEWVHTEYKELKGQGHPNHGDIAKLLKSPEVKRLWVLLRGRELRPSLVAVSTSKLYHLAKAITEASGGIPADELLPASDRRLVAQRFQRAAEGLTVAWRELRALHPKRQFPSPIDTAIREAALDVAGRVKADARPDETAARQPGDVDTVLAVELGYTDLEQLLLRMAIAATAWSAKPLLVPKPRDFDAERLYFFRKLAERLREQYGAPSMRMEAFEVMASLHGAGALVVSNIREFPPVMKSRKKQA